MEDRTISHYRILDRIGSGGMGVVFKAVDLRLQRPAALKLLPPEWAADKERKRLLLQEARLAAQLDHPHICGVYEVDETEDGSLFLAMPYYAGESLAARLVRGELPVAEALVLGIQVAEALAAAHGQGIVHRDVKPSNILITSGGGAKLLDFGLAVSTRRGPVEPTDLTPGTLRYMSPEQVQGRELDHRTDLWSFGATLYEALAARPAFGGSDAATTVRRILDDPPQPLGDGGPQVVSSLAAVVERCLAKDPRARYGDAAELLGVLRGVRDELLAPTRAFVAAPVRDDEPTLPAPPVTAPTQAAASARRRRRLGVATVFLVAAATAVGVLWLQHPWGGTARANADSSLVILPFANLTGDPGLDYLGDGIASGLIAKLSAIEGLRLVGRSAAASYRDRPVREAGRFLGAAWLVDGQVQSSGGMLRVTAHLTDAQNGAVLWAESFEGTADGIFGLQHRIASSLADALELPLSRAERSRLQRRPTESQRAYALYLQGRRALDSSPEAGAAQLAARQLREAVRLDGRFALAHAALSEALWRLFHQGGGATLARQSEAAAQRALELDPDLPEARVALARAQRASGRVEDSIAGIEAILAAHPHPAEALRELGRSYLSIGDREEAERCFRNAVTLEPDDWSGWNSLGSFLARTGDYRSARDAYLHAARLAPPSVTWPQQNVAAVLLFEGEFQQAVEAFEEIGGTTSDPLLASNMATAYFFLGELGQAEELYRRAVSLEPDNATLHRNLGDLYQRQGRTEEAVASYRRALRLVERALAAEHQPASLPLERAVLAAKVGDCSSATDGLRELWDAQPHGARSAHDAAQVWALCGDAEAALEALTAAVEAGWPAELLRSEDEFRSLADRPRFRALAQTR